MIHIAPHHWRRNGHDTLSSNSAVLLNVTQTVEDWVVKQHIHKTTEHVNPLNTLGLSPHSVIVSFQSITQGRGVAWRLEIFTCAFTRALNIKITGPLTGTLTSVSYLSAHFRAFPWVFTRALTRTKVGAADLVTSVTFKDPRIIFMIFCIYQRKKNATCTIHLKVLFRCNTATKYL